MGTREGQENGSKKGGAKGEYLIRAKGKTVGARSRKGERSTGLKSKGGEGGGERLV